jgi:hypothetical protein
MTPFKSNAFIYDGSAQKRYDGSALYDIGFARPSSVTNMSAGAGTLTGTYEAVYTWYDSAMDHDSSISDATATQALAAQGRTHTKPGGSVPSAATHWRAWVRRTDTNELNYYLAGSWTVATGSATETVTDTTRRANQIADKTSVNDPPPGNFIHLFEMNGYGFGIRANTDAVDISKLGDLQSWHPRDNFPISRATGDALTWGLEFSERRIIGTAHATWELVGDRVPFKPKRLHQTYGNVSAESCVEVDSELYGWDRIRGPYVTNLSAWRSIGNSRISNFIATVNKQALALIRCVHDEVNNLVIWSVPTTSTTRVRTLLAYHYLLGAWLPPITGHEYGSFAQFTDTNGDLGLYMGDHWGRVYQMFDGAHDGPPSGTTEETITGATVSTITASGATFYTTGGGLAGMPIAVKSPAGIWQWVRAASNTGTVITLDTTNGPELSPVPSGDGWEVIVGGIRWFWNTSFLDFKVPTHAKQSRFLFVAASSSADDQSLFARIRFNDDDGHVTAINDLAFPIEQAGAIWGQAIWGESEWSGGPGQSLKKQRFERTFVTLQIQFWNFYPSSEVRLKQFGVTCDPLSKRLVPSVNG